MEESYQILKYTQDKHPESHIHDFYEIFISLTNDGKFFVGEKAFDLSYGTVFFLNPFEIHHCFCHENKEYDRYVIHFTREQLSRLSTRQSNILKTFNSAPQVLQMPSETLANMLYQLSGLIKKPLPTFGSDVERNLKFETFLLYVACVLDSVSENPVICLTRETRVDDILAYIHKHYAEEIKLDDLSRQFYISKSRISQIFKSSTGFSIGNYIIIYRIKRACELLQDGESVQNTGRLVGFKNNTHFIRMFKQHIGCSPGRFSRNEEG